MYRYVAVILFALGVMVGCMRGSPIAPDVNATGLQTQTARPIYDDRYHLWGEWMLYFSANHDRVDVVPRREGRVHVNVLKWLEADCGNCLEIAYIENNGDSTINLGVRIKHPKPGHPEFTGFDVKGIVMFNGSYEMPISGSLQNIWPLYPEPIRMSWRERGDAEILNPDGYTIRWSPWYDSGSDLPLLNYWPGKYSMGTPTANANAYLDFWTTEERHMFSNNGVVTREYHIYLPPGPIAAGYAVEACWAPASTTPVVDPLNQFPLAANQEEPYHLALIVNNGQPLTEYDWCCGWDLQNDPCSDLRLESLQWGREPNVNGIEGLWFKQPEPFLDGTMCGIMDCKISFPEWYQGGPMGLTGPKPPAGEPGYPDGIYRGFAIVFRSDYDPYGEIVRSQIGYTIWDFVVDRE